MLKSDSCMKVADVMQKNVDFVVADMPLLAVAKIIFGSKINGVPVCKNKKVIGFIAEKDILSQFFPSMQDYMEDPLHEGDFEEMEKKIDTILSLQASKIMSRDPKTISYDTPLLKAQSMMTVNNVGRLPVVDEKNNLVGILSKGDIFRHLVGERLPFEEDEKFHDWLSKRYDIIIDQDKRLSREIPDIVRMFKKLNVKGIIDIGSGTGVHCINFAKQGFEALGLERSSRMVQVAQEKIRFLPNEAQKLVKFINTDYKRLEALLGRKFDAAIFMGSALAHIENPLHVLQEIAKVLNDKAVIICQITNYDKVIKANRRLMDFNIRKSPYPEEREQAFLRFYDVIEDGHLTQNVSVFVRASKKWMFRGMHSMFVYPLTKEKITTFLKKIRFSNIKYFGGEKGFFYDYLFRKPFKPNQSDVLVVVARR